ncbi:hypothetical protein [Gordonia polyisoprenivorans]|uniref:hypothetical protein n=1 Tax=Gordonia polyisoprenivorans TaxID=84595 RepID=UPI0030D0D66F
MPEDGGTACPTTAKALPSWPQLVAHYRAGDRVSPLVGSSVLTVESSDDDGILITQRLWRTVLRPEHWEVACAVYAHNAPVRALDLAEALRTHYQSGPDVVTECSRTPNIAAVLMRDLGFTADATGPRR